LHKAVLCIDWGLNQEKEQRNESIKNGPKKMGQKRIQPERSKECNKGVKKENQSIEKAERQRKESNAKGGKEKKMP